MLKRRQHTTFGRISLLESAFLDPDFAFSVTAHFNLLKSESDLIDDHDNPIDESISTISTSLLNAAMEGKGEAWERLVFVYSRLVYRWCRIRKVSPDDALDIGQNVFAAASKNLASFRRETPSDTFRGWLRRITERKIVDYWRDQKKNGLAGADEQLQSLLNQQAEEEHRRETESVSEVDSDEKRELIKRILKYSENQVNPKHWQIFWDTVVEQKDRVDVAEKHGVKRANVDVVVSRVLAKMKGVFAEDL